MKKQLIQSRNQNIKRLLISGILSIGLLSIVSNAYSSVSDQINLPISNMTYFEYYSIDLNVQTFLVLLGFFLFAVAATLVFMYFALYETYVLYKKYPSK